MKREAIEYKHIGVIREGTPLIREAVLIDMGIKIKTIHRGFERGLERWQGEHIGNELYLEFGRFTARLRNKIKAEYGNVMEYIGAYEAIQQAKQLDERILMVQEQMIVADRVDVDWFGELRKNNGVEVYTLEECKQLSVSCAWGRLCNMVNGSSDAKKWGFRNRKELVLNVIEALEMEKVKAPRIKNYRKFTEWLKRFAYEENEDFRTGRWTLVHKHIGNSNRQILNDAAKDWLIDRMGSTKKPSFEKVKDMFNDDVWQELGCKSKISVSTVKAFLNHPDIKNQWYLARHGKKGYYNHRQGYSKRKRATFPDAKWTIDGTTIQLLYTDEQGKLQKDWYYVFYVFDNHSERILSAVIDRRERADLVEDAIKTALTSTMKKPYELESDNGKAIVAKHITKIIERFTHVYLKNAPYKPRGRRAEQLIGRVEHHVMSVFDNFKGGNITSKDLNYKANPDFIKKALKKGNKLRFADMNPVDQMRLVVGLWNNKKGKRDGLTPNERYAKANDKREELTYDELVSLWMIKRPKPIMYKPNGLTLHYKGKTYNYWKADEDGVNDLKFRGQWMGTKFDVYFDAHHTDVVYLYKNDKEIAIATLKPELVEAKADQTKVDNKRWKERLRSENDYVKLLETKHEATKKRVRRNGYAELGVEHLMKDELNTVEMQGLMDELGINLLEENGVLVDTDTGEVLTKPKPKTKKKKRSKADKYRDFADLSQLKN